MKIRAFSLTREHANVLEQMKVFTEDKNVTPTGLVWFWDGNMANVTSIAVDSQGVVHSIFTTVMTHIVVDSITDEGKPHSSY